MDLSAAAATKRIILTVTTGRTGTNLLADALNVSRRIHTVHESKAFINNMRSVQSTPSLATDVWINEMLPLICSRKEPIFAETGHITCKGYLKPLLELGVIPDLILIKRSPRDVARSFTSLDSIAGRSKNGLKYLLSPEDPDVLQLPGHEDLNDYQLNYWYCLEIERRSRELTELVRSHGGTVAKLPFKELIELSSFQNFWESFELPELGALGWWRIKRILSHKVNSKAKKKSRIAPKKLSSEELPELEQEVIERIGDQARELSA